MSLDQRVAELERGYMLMAADISALRAQYRTDMQWLKESLARIEDKLDDRPSRAELEAVPSKAPSLFVKGFGIQARLRRISAVAIVLLLAEGGLLWWLLKK